MKKSILVVSNNKLFIDSTVERLRKQDFHIIIISDVEIPNQQIREVSCFSDIFLLEEIVSGVDAVIYENLSSQNNELNSISSINNMVNLCVSYPDKRLIYIGNQKGYNTSPFEITMDENAVNNFTKEILPPVRQSLLMELEVLRGINEGCLGLILSTANLLTGIDAKDDELYQIVIKENNALNYFVNIGTLLDLVVDAVHNQLTGKYLIYDEILSKETLSTKVDSKRPTFWEKIISSVFPGPKMNRLMLNNEYSQKQLKFELKKT